MACCRATRAPRAHAEARRSFHLVRKHARNRGHSFCLLLEGTENRRCDPKASALGRREHAVFFRGTRCVPPRTRCVFRGTHCVSAGTRCVFRGTRRVPARTRCVFRGTRCVFREHTVFRPIPTH